MGRYERVVPRKLRELAAQHGAPKPNRYLPGITRPEDEVGDLTAVHQETERLREAGRVAQAVAASYKARAETAEAERDEEKARGDHLLQQLVSEGDRFVAARDQVDQLRAERDKLREALEFYADATNYTVALKGSGRDRHGVIGGKMDKGKRAREALAPAPVDEERDR